MLNNREVGQIATAMAHAAIIVNGVPHVSLVAAFEILASHADEPVVFSFEGNRISWVFGKEAKAAAAGAKILALVPTPITVSCMAHPKCTLPAGHEGACDIPPGE